MKTLKSLSVLTAAVLSNSLSLNAASDDPHTEYRPYGL